MCYAKPGPRCSTHAKQALVKATAAAEAAEQAFAATTHGFMTDEYGELLKARQQTYAAQVQAEATFDATTGGIALLKEQMAARVEACGPVAVESDEEFKDLRRRLEHGQETRRNQMAAYKAIHQAQPWTDHRAALPGRD